MNKSLLTLLSIVFLAACTQKTKLDCNTYEEATLPVTVYSKWNAIPSGLQASVGSIDERYVKHEIPEISQQTEWKGTAWKGERVSAQLVVWSKDSVEQIHGKISDFKSADGNKIASENVSIHFVRYVITDAFAENCAKPVDYIPTLSPDMLDNIECMNISPNTTRPIWVTMNVPADAAPGNYTATLQLYANGKKADKFNFQLEVLPQTLPPASEWVFHLDLWQNPYAVARVAGVEPWTQEHWDALTPVMKMLADAGQKVITATLNKRPWNGQTEDAFDTMIKWTKKTDGTWSYDFTVFDNWVQFMMNLGIKNQINCYSMVPWGNFLFYQDEASGEEIRVSAAPGTKEYADLWVPFLQEFVKHLDEKGWRDITRIAMDERAPDEMKAMLKLLEETAPGMGVALADNHKSYKLYPDQLQDLCVQPKAIVEKEDLKYRKEKSHITTWYVCCADEFPNVFTYSAPAEGAFIGWRTMAADFDGFLRWAYNSWVAEPLIDSRFRTWSAGDTYIMYPDARSSIRFERLIEGIQDAEKIRILREKFQNDASAEATEKLNLLNETVAKFDIVDNPGNTAEMLWEGKKVLNDLSR